MTTTSTASTDLPRRGPTGFYASLLDRFSAIVGEGAGYATFHFAALQEGLERVRGMDVADVPKAVAMAAATLGHEATASDDDDAIRVAVGDCTLLDRESRILEGVLVGFYEGALRGATGAVHEGRLEREAPGRGTIHLRRKGSA